jgi:hypothetical protein
MMGANTCYNCPDYIPRGLCNRLDDGATVFIVSSEQIKCLFIPRKRRLTAEEISVRDLHYREETERFQRSLGNASKIVASWPLWQRRCLGGVGYILNE